MNLLTKPTRWSAVWALVLGLCAGTAGAQVVLSEFMASNSRTRADEDGDYSDWIELHNPGNAAVNLDDWFLTDDAAVLRKWRLPSVQLAAKGFLVVFASGKDRGLAGQELHTNFQLDEDGEYLALVQPDGTSVSSQFAPRYPAQRVDVSYGQAAPFATATFVAPGAATTVLIPRDASLGNTWTIPSFLPNGWTAGTNGVGYGITDPTQPPAAGRLLWLAADVGVTADGGGTVTAWTDAGGLHGNWVESVRGTPRRTTAAFPRGNRSVIRFEGNIDGLTLIEDASLRANPISLFVVASVDANERSAIFIANYRDVSGFALGISDAVSQRVKWFTAPPGDGFDDGFSSFPAADLLPEKNYLITATFDAASNNKVLAIRDENGANERSAAGTFHSQAGYAIDTQLTVGNLDFGRQFLDGDITEILVYASVSTAQRDAVEAYLMNKYFAPQPPVPSSLVATDVGPLMAGVNASAYLRTLFQLAAAATFDKVTLRIQYDDGFVAYLDGQEMARRNAPDPTGVPVPYNGTASADRPLSSARVAEEIDVTAWAGSLSAGSHVLAIHGLNDSANSTDFLIRSELTAEVMLPSAVPLGFLQAPTPGTRNNTDAYLGVVADTQFSVDRGFYDAPVQVAITSVTPGAEIRYTLNGSLPTTNHGTIYTGPLTVSNTTTLRAAAFKPGYLPTGVDTHTYLFVNDAVGQSPMGQPPPGWPASPLPTGQVLQYGMDPDVVDHPLYSGSIRDALKSVPTFSIVMEQSDLLGPQGIYANPSGDGPEWERPASLELIYPDGAVGFQIDAGIRIRGGQSRSVANPKHAFRLFFRNEYGEGRLNYRLFKNSPLDRFEQFDLRMDQNDSWSFVGDCCGRAENAIYLRDVFVRDTQLAMGQPATRSDYYHLYLNGQYWGLANTQERAEADFAASYLGGAPEDYDVIKVDWGPFTVYATDGDMTAWTEFYNLIKAGVTGEAAYQFLLGNNPDGTRNPAFKMYLDVDNLIDFMLLTLYTGNLDSAISTFSGRPNNWYAIRPRDGRAGFRFLVHDAEITMLNVNANRTSPLSNAGDASVLDSSPEWMWHKLLANATFRLRAADRIHKHFFNDGVFTPQSAKTRFLARKAEIDLAIIAESARWGDARRAAPFTRNLEWLNLVNQLAVNPNCYFDQRAAIVLGQLTAAGVYPALPAPSFDPWGGTVTPGFALSMSAPTGTVYYTLEGSDPWAPGGSVSLNTSAYSSPLTLTESVVIRARALSGRTWSALTEATYEVIQGYHDLLLTEIMYHPLASTNADGTAVDGDEFEFLELKNAGANTRNLGGMAFTSGINFTFTNGTHLSPGQFFVLVRNPAQFAARYPGVTLHGVYAGKLDNGGETLRLAHVLGSTALSVTYGERAPWPVTPDGSGFSLVPVNPNVNADPNAPANWRGSTRLGGSPGADDPPTPVTLVRINEVLTHTDPPQVDTLELYNPNPTEAEVSGWYLTDDRAVPKKFRIPDDKRIPPGGFLLFDETQFNPHPGVDPSFTLSSHGEEVYLFSADAAGHLTGFSDGFSFGAAENGVTFGRYVNSVGEVLYPAQRQNSLKAPNAGPKIGPVVINEIRYHPAQGDEEFVELLNMTGTAVKLYDPAYPTNTWRINGVDFNFPANVELPANSLLLVAGSDPVAFRARHSVPANVLIFGPYFGALQDNGELLELQRPDAPDVDTNGLATVPYITVDEVRYNDRTPWPTNATGFGPSLERLRADAYGNDPANWRASPGNASPGLSNSSNRLPRVNAGADQQLQSGVVPFNATLQATVEDDGLPPPPARLTTTWSQVSGPGIATFADATRINTTVSLPGIGTYVLRLTASDSELQAGDDVTLVVERPPLPSFVPAGSEWQYLADGSDQGTAWRAPGFSDATWKRGKAQLGYGDGDEATTIGFGPDSANKFITYYFRKTFPLANVKAITSLTVKLVRDDGAVVYLNGEEVFRSNTPEGDINFRTPASEAVSGGDESKFFRRDVDPALLKEGSNVLAVEVHQQNGGSSDVSFDLELVGLVTPANSAPTVSAGNDQTIIQPVSAVLNGSASDDGLPNPPGFVTITWSEFSGPGMVTFANANATDTTASFSVPGTYVVWLTASDGEFTRTDDLTITVNPGQAPVKFESAELVTTPSVAIVLRFTTQPGQSYTVQYHDSLSAGAWHKLRDMDAQPSAGVAEISDPITGTHPSRYYRIVSPKEP